MKMKNVFLVLASMLVTQTTVYAASTGSPAVNNNWEIDGRHSNIAFSIRHMMVSNVRGQFNGITGTAKYNGKDLNGLSVDAKVDAKTVNTNEPARDKHLMGPDFFDVEKYPFVAFKSTKIKAGKAGRFKLIGDLTMHGVTKSVELDVEGPSPAVKDPQGNIRVGASATTKLNRKDFGINYNSILDNGGAMVGDNVDLTLDVELLQKAEAGK